MGLDKNKGLPSASVETPFQRPTSFDLGFRFLRNFLADDIHDLAVGFNSMPICHASEIIAAAFSWAISNEEIQRELIDRYFKSLKERNSATA